MICALGIGYRALGNISASGIVFFIIFIFFLCFALFFCSVLFCFYRWYPVAGGWVSALLSPPYTGVEIRPVCGVLLSIVLCALCMDCEVCMDYGLWVVETRGQSIHAQSFVSLLWLVILSMLCFCLYFFFISLFLYFLISLFGFGISSWKWKWN